MAAALAPAIFNPYGADVFGLPKLTVIAVAVVVSGGLLGMAGAEPGAVRTPLPRVLPVVGAYLVVIAIATVASTSRLTSFLGAYERFNGLVPMLVNVAFAALVVRLWWRDPAGLRTLGMAFLVGGGLLAAYVLLQGLGLDWIDWQEKSGLAAQYQAGGMGNSSFAGGYLGAMVPLAVAGTLSAARSVQARVIAAVLAVGLVVALLLTASRAGLLAIAAGGIVVVAIGAGRRLSLRQRVASVGVLGGLVLLVGVLAVGRLSATGGVPAPNTTAVQAAGERSLLRTESLRIRAREWQGALEIVRRHPLLGTGPETFGSQFARYRSEEDAARLGSQIADKPHNLVLEHAAAAGVPGALAYLALVAAIAWTAVRRLFTRRVQEDGNEATGALLWVTTAVFAAEVAQAQFSIEVPPFPLLFWCSAAAIVVLADDRIVEARAELADFQRRARTKGKRPPAARAQGVTPGVAAVTLVLGAVLLWAATRPIRADLAAGSALRGTLEGAAMHLDAAHALHPFEPAYRMQAGYVQEARGAESADPTVRATALQQSVGHYERALELQPDSVFAVIGKARSLTLLARGVDAGRFPEADAWWQRAVELDPLDWEVADSHGLMLNSWANASAGDQDLRRRAAAELERAVAIRGDLVATWINLVRIHASLGDEEASLRALERAEALEPGHPEVLELRAGVSS